MATLFARAPAALPRKPSNLQSSIHTFKRHLQTLPKSPHVYIFPHPHQPKTHLLTLLPTSPPKPDLALGTSTANPPEPESFTENHHFLELLQSVVADNATADPDVQREAQSHASTGGASLGSGGAFFRGQSKAGRNRGKAIGGGGGAGQGGAGGASAQGGMGGGGVGGWIHVADQRNPPDWGRTPWPEDILGSLQVDGQGKFVGPNGSYQRSGTYRVCTRDGVCHLSPFLREKVVQQLKEIEKNL